MRLRFLSLLIVASWSLTACNVMRMLERSGNKTFKKNGLVAHTFTDAAGPHFVWSSVESKDTGGLLKPKLMLVHGITGSSRMWVGNVAALSEHYDLIVPDLIGHGRSTTTWSGSSVDAQVAHLQLILDSLRMTEPVYVVGNSYGGAMVANFAEQHPERVRSLVIYDGPASDYTAAIADSVARSVGAKDITDLFTPKNKDEQYRLLELSLYKVPHIPGFALRQINEHMQAHSASYLGLLKDLLDREDLYARKEYRWPMPVYVIWGAEDRLIPLATGRGIVARNHLAADHFIIIPQAGHVANIEQGAVFESELLRILKE
ncbi:MAG: alpha/beta hydrolase [Flavobacteriales bacterium]